MERKRKAYAPFSQTSEAGVAQTPVEGYIDVNQTIYPTVQTGVVNENGTWVGVKSSDREFRGFTKFVAIPNSDATLFPDTGTENFINMKGFNSLFLAINPNEGGGSGFRVQSVMGPDTNRFANLRPVNSGGPLRGNNAQSTPNDWENLFDEGGQTMTQDVWNIFAIKDILKDWQNLQFKITNNTGATATFEVAFMRLV